MTDSQFFFRSGKLGLVLGAVLVGTLTGCNRQPVIINEAAPPVQTTVAVQDDFVYYPNYEVYYNSSRHEYAYREGDAWVSRPAPRGVSVDVLAASPSVKMDFHDAPANHHAEIARQYPKDWSAAGRKENQPDGHGADSGHQH
jgi:hypothetical protein